MHELRDVGPKPSAGAKTFVKLKPRTSAKSVLGKADRAQRARDRLPRSTAAGDDTLRNRIDPMEEEGAVGELEEEEEGAVDEWAEEGAVDVVVSDSEEELAVLRQPNLVQKLAAVVTQRASCVIELEGGAPLTNRPATQRRRPYPPPTSHKAPALLSHVCTNPLHFPRIMPVIAPSLPPSWF